MRIDLETAFEILKTSAPVAGLTEAELRGEIRGLGAIVTAEHCGFDKADFLAKVAEKEAAK